jgi:hypothetical protein
MRRLGLFLYCYRAILVAAIAIAADRTWADEPNTKSPADPATAPPAQPPLGQTLEGLIKQTGYAYKQPNNSDSTMFDVYVDYRGEVYSVRLTEQSAEWKYADNTEPRFVTMWMPVTPWYTKNNEVPPELTRAVAVANENDSWISYGLYVTSTSKDWVISCEAQVFLKGMNVEVFSDYLQLMANSKLVRKGQFAQFVADDASSSKN